MGVRPGDLISDLELPGQNSETVRLRDYRRRRNVVLYFMERADCADCREKLAGLASSYGDLVFEDAEVVVVVAGAVTEIVDVKRRLGLSCPVLSDEAGEAFRRYGATDDRGRPRAAVFVADRFGEVYEAAVAGDRHELPSWEDVKSWLTFIQIQCPECGAPAWPRLSDV